MSVFELRQRPSKCHACGELIERGQEFVVVNAPGNKKVRVHVKCMGAKK